MLIEETPRLTISQLRELPSWPEIEKNGEANVTLELNGIEKVVQIELCYDDVPFGRRSWFRCPGCGDRRVDLFMVGDRLGCRACLKIRYFIHSLPRGHWKSEIAIPAIRTANRSRRAAKEIIHGRGIQVG